MNRQAECFVRSRGSATLFVLAVLTSGWASRVFGQEATEAQTIPEIEPRLERLWGSDSLRLSVNMCGVQCSNQVSLSPDGRWILFQSYDPSGESKLWLAPTGGGDMVEVASGPSNGGEPQWFPSGEAIAFTSPKLGEHRWFSVLMRVPVSPSDGRPQGTARQVSLETVEPIAISPDGSTIAYIADADPTTQSGSVLKVIPSTGGNPVSVRPIRGLGIVMALRWGADGQHLYFLTWRDIDGDGMHDEMHLYRVPPADGEPELLSTWNEWVHISPRARYLLRQLPSAEGEDPAYEAATLEGRPLARFHLPSSFELAGFAGGPGELLAVRQDIVNPLRILPVAGGPIRRLNDAWGYDVPLAWTEDGTEVFFRTTLNGERAFLLAPVAGGPMREVPLPWNAEQPRLSRNGEQVFYLVRESDLDPGAELFVHDVATGARRQVTTPAEPYEVKLLGSIDGRAAVEGSRASGAVFAYVMTRARRHEVYLVDRSGASSLGWSLPEGQWAPGDRAFANVAIHGDLLAFTDNDGPEGTLFVARAGEEARALLTLPGSLGPRGANAARWSPDGRTLTMSYRAPDWKVGDLLFVEVDGSGELVGEPRTLSRDDGPDWQFAVQWLPDGQHFTALGGPATPDGGQDVWLFSLDPNTPPVNLTQELRWPVWYYHLSPDGRYIAFESEMPRGSSIWRVVLEGLLGEEGR